MAGHLEQSTSKTSNFKQKRHNKTTALLLSSRYRRKDGRTDAEHPLYVAVKEIVEKGGTDEVLHNIEHNLT